jgi:hypothetical protein
MTTATDTTLIWRAATTAEMYNWIKKVSDALTAVGCVLTSDTGQISLAGTTVAIPATPDETFKQAGYQVRKLETSGKPTLYIRIDYGVRRYSSFSTAATNVAPAIRITVGTETNGAGVLSGVSNASSAKAYSDYGYYYAAEQPMTGARPLFFSSDGQNYLTMLIDPALAGGSLSYRINSIVPLVFGLERSVTPETGAYDSDGFVLLNACSVIPSGETQSPYAVANIPGGALYYGGAQSVPAQNTGLFTSSFSAGSTNLFPVTVCLPKPKGPMKSALYYYNADVADGYTFSTTMYGETRTFIAGGSLQARTASTGTNSVSAALRYD